MSGTAKTTAALLTEQPDNTSNLVLPQQMRNLTVSGPQWDVVSAAAAPGILRGCVELGDYILRNPVGTGCAVGAGQTTTIRQNNAAAVQNAFNYAATNSKFLEFAPNIIEINNAAGILLQASSFGGFRLFGSKENSVLAQFFTGAPVMTIGPTDGTSIPSVVIDGMKLLYSGADSTATVLNVGFIYFSKVSNLSINGNMFADTAIYVGAAAGNVLPFSNIFANLTAAQAKVTLLECDGTATGNVWINCYLNNNVAGAQALSLAPLTFGWTGGAAPDETTFDQLNIEHCKAPMIMGFNGGSATFLGCHWENVQLTGASPIFWRLASAATNISIVGGTTVDLGLNSGLMSGTATYFSFYDDAQISMRAHRFKNTGSPAVVRNMQIQMYSPPDGLTPASVTRPLGVFISDTRLDASYKGFMSLDPSTPRATYGDLELIDGYRGRSVYTRITGRACIVDPPTATVIYGALGSDIIVRYNTPLTGNVTLTLATLLISGGTLNRPALDQIRVIRESSCTGAFTITVRNAALTTIGSAFTTASAGTSQVYVHTTTAGTWTQTV